MCALKHRYFHHILIYSLLHCISCKSSPLGILSALEKHKFLIFCRFEVDTGVFNRPICDKWTQNSKKGRRGDIFWSGLKFVYVHRCTWEYAYVNTCMHKTQTCQHLTLYQIMNLKCYRINIDHVNLKLLIKTEFFYNNVDVYLGFMLYAEQILYAMFL